LFLKKEIGKKEKDKMRKMRNSDFVLIGKLSFIYPSININIKRIV
jgi:hypothetical protein